MPVISSPPAAKVAATTWQSDEAASKVSTSGSLSGRSVKVQKDASNIVSDPNQPRSSAATTGTVTGGTGNFVNRSSATHTESRTAGRFLGSGSRLSSLKRFAARFFSRLHSGAAQQTAAPTAAGNVDVCQITLDAARLGVDGAKKVLNEKIVGAQHDTQAVHSLLLSGDPGGIRRATTASTALLSSAGSANPQTYLPQDASPETVQQWRGQTQAITQMTRQIQDAEFNTAVKGRFLQYGTTQDNPFSTVADSHPHLDHAVRDWLADGVDLLDKLIAGQERLIQGEPPLNQGELTRLQNDVQRFADANDRNTLSFDKPGINMDDAKEQIDTIYENAQKADK